MTQRDRRLALVLVIFLSSSVRLLGQAIYAENQLPARGVQIEYSVTIKNPVMHLFDVEMDVRGIREASVEVAMPAWEPGAYSIRDFAKNVQDFHAFSSRNQPLSVQKTDKLTWQISKAAAEDVTVRYQVFSNRLNDDL